MKRRTTRPGVAAAGAGLSLSLLLVLAGCAGHEGHGLEEVEGATAGSGEAELQESSEEQLLKEYLEYSGFDTSEFSVNDELGIVSAGEDAAFMLDDVREQLYSQKGYDAFGFTARFDTPSGPVIPYTIKKIHSSFIGDIKLKFETPQTHWWATHTVNDFWKAAFRDAAAKWSAADSNVDIHESNRGGNAGATISIMFTTRTFCDTNGDGRNDCIAMAAWPGFGHPGHYILVDPTAGTGCSGNWIPPGCSGAACFARMVHLALHEMGHTLGFAHPGCGNHISGTSKDNSCNPGSAYTTTMVTPIDCNSNGMLSSDDINSIRRTY